MKSNCINGQPHRFWCYTENGIDYQVCRNKGCNVVRARRVLNKKNMYFCRFGRGKFDARIEDDIVEEE